MKITVKSWHAIGYWKWETGQTEEDGEEDVCGICRVAYEGCCPGCKMPGDDCPLMWGECSHVFHMHCILKWLGTTASKQCCPMDRRPWATAAQHNVAARLRNETNQQQPQSTNTVAS